MVVIYCLLLRSPPPPTPPPTLSPNYSVVVIGDASSSAASASAPPSPLPPPPPPPPTPSPDYFVVVIGDADAPLLKHRCYRRLKSWHVTALKRHFQNRIHTNQPYQFRTALSRHSNNLNLCLFSRPPSVRLFYFQLLGCPQRLLDKLQKDQKGAAEHVRKTAKSV